LVSKNIATNAEKINVVFVHIMCLIFTDKIFVFCKCSYKSKILYHSGWFKINKDTSLNLNSWEISQATIIGYTLDNSTVSCKYNQIIESIQRYYLHLERCTVVSQYSQPWRIFTDNWQLQDHSQQCCIVLIAGTLGSILN